MNDKIIVLFGASATGKTSLANYLVKYCGYHQIKTTTTRPKRTHNENDYHFVSVKQFKSMQTFASTNFAGNYYGSSLDDVKQSLNKYHKLVIILTWSGVIDYFNEFKHSKVQVIPLELYAMSGTILERLRNRPDNHMTKQDIINRLNSYQKQAKQAQKSSLNYHVINSYQTDNKIDSTRNEIGQLKQIL